MEKKQNPHAGHRQRKKAQFRESGLDSFAPHEALELLLYYAIPRSDTNALAHELLHSFGSLDGVFKAPVEELMKVEGIGENAALLIRLVPQIFRRSQTELDKPGLVIADSNEAGEFFRKYFWSERDEIVMIVCLDSKCRMIGRHKLCDGDSGGGTFNVRDVARYALSDNASYVYMAHNHPSGVAQPSNADIVTTRVVNEVLRSMNICLADHIIVAENDFVSLRSSGLLDY